MFADITDKIEEGVFLHPVVIINQFGSIGRIAFEIEKFGQLPLNAFLVVTQSRLIEQVTFGRLAGRVANHTGRPTHQRNGFMAGPLKMTQHHYTYQMSDM